MSITPEQIAAIAKRHRDAVHNNNHEVRQSVLEGAIREALMLDRHTRIDPPLAYWAVRQ